MIVAVDFDGTIVDHQYPDIGMEAPGAISALKELQARGVKLILWTMRSDDREGRHPLTEAVQWCRKQGVEFWGVNSNPAQSSWTNSPKAHAHVYVDDAAFGCPLREHPSAKSSRPCVDWSKVLPTLLNHIKDN